MKYGVLFSTLAMLVTIMAFRSGGWYFLLLWPAESCALVGIAYLRFGHSVFGKRPDGSMAFVSILLLWPYLMYLWAGWHMIRLVSREPTYDILIDKVLIGRRLLSSELPDDVRTVVDLTCEFPEPLRLRSVQNYISAPMLDASCLSSNQLVDLVTQIRSAERPIYIHCAQGHGRTGLIAALLLVSLQKADGPEQALKSIRESRPNVGLNRAQRSALGEACSLLTSHDST